MKNFGKIISAFLCCFFCVVGCLSDSDETIVLEDKQKSGSINGGDYFEIENATFRSGSMPSSTSGESLSYVSMNTSALAGGMNFITIRSTEKYDKFYIGADDVNGYYEYDTEDAEYQNGVYVYTIPLEYSVDYSDDMTLKIVGDNTNGGATKKYTQTVKYVESQYGALNVNLTFENAKDLDLHVLTPSGKHLYYGNEGGYYETETGREIFFGLDHDSNAGCRIDNLNNENIVIPYEFIESGVYKVYVNMYSNCNSSISTQWLCAVRYKGTLVKNALGKNPVSGVFPVGTKGNSDLEYSEANLVMKFSISKSKSAIVSYDKIIESSFRPKEISLATQCKMREKE
jgi:hypothetical protein